MKRVFVPMIAILSTAFSLMSGASIASAMGVTCPSSILTHQVATQALSGWQSINDKLNGQQDLVRVDVFDGPPLEGADLVPDARDNAGNPVWTFAKKNCVQFGWNAFTHKPPFA